MRSVFALFVFLLATYNGQCIVFADSEIKVYNGHSYQLIEKGMPWDSAVATCKSKTNNSGYLAIISTKGEDDFIYQNFLRNNPKPYVWLGARIYGKRPGHKVEWIAGEPTSSYENFHSGEPNKYKGRAEDCLVYSVGGGRKGWNDITCNYGYYPLCEWEKTLSSDPGDGDGKKDKSVTKLKDKFVSYWPIPKGGQTSFWKERLVFNNESYERAKLLAFSGKAISTSKDLVDIYATLAVGAGIFDIPGLATKFYKVGATLYGADTPEALGTADRVIGMASIVKDGFSTNEKFVKAIEASRIAIKNKFGAKAVSFAEDADKFSDVSNKVSAVESLGINVLGVIIDEVIINRITSTVEYQLHQMKEHLILTYLAEKIIPLWEKGERDQLNSKNIQALIELELFYFEKWRDELEIRKRYWEAEDDAKEIEMIEDIEKDVLYGLNKRLQARMRILRN